MVYQRPTHFCCRFQITFDKYFEEKEGFPLEIGTHNGGVNIYFGELLDSWEDELWTFTISHS